MAKKKPRKGGRGYKMPTTPSTDIEVAQTAMVLVGLQGKKNSVD